MPMNDVATPVIYAEHGSSSKHAKAAAPTAPQTSTSTANSMTNSTKSDFPHSGGGVSGGGVGSGAPISTQLGTTVGPSLASMQGQKWQQVFDLDKVIKQLRSAEKTYLRGGSKSSSGSSSDGHSKNTGPHSSVSGGHVVQVQRLNAQDMPYYDIAPKQAIRDVVVCNTCNCSYTKAGFTNHVALKHPHIWESMPNKVNFDAYRSAGLAAVSADNSQDGVREPGSGAAVAGAELGSPTDTLSGSMSTCSNGSSSCASLQLAYNSAAGAAAASSSSSRHKSSSKSSSSGSSSKAGSSSRSRSKSSKNRHHASPSSSELSAGSLHHSSSYKSGGSSSKKGSGALSSAIAAPPAALTHAQKEEAPVISVFSSSSNSSCSMPATPKMDGALTVSSGGANADHSLGSYSAAQLSLMLTDVKPETQQKKKTKGNLTAAAEPGTDYHRTKLTKDKQMLPHYEQHAQQQQQQAQQQQLSELDQAVSSITDDANASYGHGQHQVDLSAMTEEPMATTNNASDDNSISLTLDDMLDSKFINEILNTAESDLPFDESALDTAQQQQQQNGASSSNYMPSASKRMRYEDGTIHPDAGEYTAAALYQQQQHSNNAANIETHEQTQLTAIDAMQLQQLIYHQQQMLEQDDQKQSYEQAVANDVAAAAAAAAAAASAQFSVYNVRSLTDDDTRTSAVEGNNGTGATAGGGGVGVAVSGSTGTGELDEHMILPSIIYEITDNNQVSVLDQQSQQQVIAEFLSQAGYDNVDVNVLQAAEQSSNTQGQHLNDELSDFDFTKLETVSAEATNNTKTVKLEASQPQLQLQLQPQTQQPPAPAPPTYNSSYPCENYKPQPHRQLVNAKYHEDSYFNVLLYANAPRPLAMNTFGLVKLPNGLGSTLRKNLLTTRKANNSLLSPNSSSGVVGNLLTPRLPLTNSAKQPANELTLANSNGSSGSNGLLLQQRHMGKTIYAQKSGMILQEHLKCNKRAFVSKLEHIKQGSSSTVGGSLINAKRLSDLLAGKAKPDKDRDNDGSSELQQQQQQERIQSFYERQRNLLASSNQRLRPPISWQDGISSSGVKATQQPLLKKQLLRTLSDCGGNSNSNNPWKSNNSTPGSNSSGSDLMRVFV